MATLPVPAGWKPNNKNEVLAWLGNIEIQLGSAMEDLDEENKTKLKLYIVTQLISRVEALVNAG